MSSTNALNLDKSSNCRFLLFQRQNSSIQLYLIGRLLMLQLRQVQNTQSFGKGLGTRWLWKINNVKIIKYIENQIIPIKYM